jgi:hypothetical protein
MQNIETRKLGYLILVVIHGSQSLLLEGIICALLLRLVVCRGMAQAVEYLFCKCEAMSSNPSPPKKKKITILLLKQKGVFLIEQQYEKALWKKKALWRQTE